MTKRGNRIEKDYLGKKRIPMNAYYGIQTQRAIENFPISGIRLQKSLIYAIAIIKKSAAMANISEKSLNKKKGNAIVKACEDILHGKFDSEFPVDVFQAGAGTSQNMNLNEVIANSALEILGKKKGSYNIIHPNDDVNLAQSTNDVFHSAIHISAYIEVRKGLLPALNSLEIALNKKAKQWKNIIKSGRTHLCDAVPMTLGQEFSGYAGILRKDTHHIEEDSEQLLEINLGGTAIGTGINTTKGYQKRVIEEINKITKFPFRRCKNLFEGTQSLSAITSTSASLKVLATDLIKIANDIRLLASGPATGLNEITLPAVQPGSSIMPGKVNPVIAEMLSMVCFQVIGNDTVITLCSQAGQLELNVMMPVAGYDLHNSIEILANSIEVFTEKCIKGIKANEKKCREYLEKNPIIVTALSQYIGYEKSAEIAKRAYKEGKTVRKIVLEERLLDEKTLNKALDFHRMIGK